MWDSSILLFFFFAPLPITIFLYTSFSSLSNFIIIYFKKKKVLLHIESM